jgi:hypothetical protein
MIASAIVFAVLRLRPEASAATAVAAVPSVAPEPTAAPPATTAPAAQPPSAAPADNPELLAAAAASPALKPEAALTPQQPTAAAPAAERTRKRKSAADEPAPPAPSAPSTTAEPQADSQDEPAEKPDPAPSPRAEPVAPSGSDFFSSAAPLSDTPSHAQVMRTMREVQPQVRACAQGHAASTATVAVTVLGATGRVSRVRISGVPEQVGNCIGHAVHAAKFPRFMRSEFAIDYAFRLGE